MRKVNSHASNLSGSEKIKYQSKTGDKKMKKYLLGCVDINQLNCSV
jgi:hypothetical protein